MNIAQLRMVLNISEYGIMYFNEKALYNLNQLKEIDFIKQREDKDWEITEKGKSFSNLILRYANDNIAVL